MIVNVVRKIQGFRGFFLPNLTLLGTLFDQGVGAAAAIFWTVT